MKTEIRNILIIIGICILVMLAMAAIGYYGLSGSDIGLIIVCVIIVAFILMIIVFSLLGTDIITRICGITFFAAYFGYPFLFDDIVMHGGSAPFNPEGEIYIGRIVFGLSIAGITYVIIRVILSLAGKVEVEKKKLRAQNEEKERDEKAAMDKRIAAEKSEKRVLEYASVLQEYAGNEKIHVLFVIDTCLDMKHRRSALETDFAEKIRAYNSLEGNVSAEIITFGKKINEIKRFETIEKISSDDNECFRLDEDCKQSCAIDSLVKLIEMQKIKENGKTVFEIYTSGGNGYSTTYTSSYYNRVIKEKEETGAFLFKFNIDRIRFWALREYLMLTHDPDIHTFSDNYQPFSFDRLDIEKLNDYFSVKKEHSDYLILRETERSSELVAYNEDAMILGGLLAGECIGPIMDQIQVIRFGYERYENIVQTQAYKDIVEFELCDKKINYMIINGKEIVDVGKFGNNYVDFPKSVFEQCNITIEELRRIWTIISDYPIFGLDVYYDGKEWVNLDRMPRKTMSCWEKEYPGTPIYEILENRVDSPIRANGNDATKVLSLLVGSQWSQYVGLQIFGIMNALEEARVNYVIICSGKIAFEGHFDDGAENLRVLINEYNNTCGTSERYRASFYKQPGRIESEIKKRKYHVKVRELNQQLPSIVDNEKDHFIAHEMKVYRRWEDQPKLAISLFHDFEQFAGDCMYTSVAAAYNDIGDKENAIKYINMASKNEYSENARKKILGKPCQ